MPEETNLPQPVAEPAAEPISEPASKETNLNLYAGAAASLVLVAVLIAGSQYLLKGRTNVASTYEAIVNPATWPDAMDYFIQDVCLNAAGQVMMGVSPVDGNPACVSHRDLQPGERLPYHKENPRNNGTTDRLDEFPMDTGTSLGTIAVKIKDNFSTTTGSGEPNVLDIGDGIGNIYLQSPTNIDTFATMDGNGPTFRISSDCSDADGGVPDDFAGLLNAQVRVTSDILAHDTGTYTTTFAKVYNPGPCPTTDREKIKNGMWKLAYYSFTRPDGTSTGPLQTLITNSTDPTHHFERYYQTREVGRIRYEAWQNTSTMDEQTKEIFEAMAQKLKDAGGDCATQYEPPPDDSGNWLLFECGEWTSFTPPDDMVNGDYPDQFIDALKTGNMTAELFGLTSTDNPHIDSVTPTSFDNGAPTTLTFTGDFMPHDAEGEVIVMFDGGAVHAYETPTDNNTTVTYQVDWGDTRDGHSLSNGMHTIHIFDGVSMSNPITVTVNHVKGKNDEENDDDSPLNFTDLDPDVAPPAIDIPIPTQDQ